MPTTNKFKKETVNQIAKQIELLTSKIYIDEVLAELDNNQNLDTNIAELWQTYEALSEDLKNLQKAIEKYEEELI